MSAWYVNLEPSKPGGAPWTAYAEKDRAKIEAAWGKTPRPKSCMLNETYKIDFVKMKQVRRDDVDRWRHIKRGGRPDAPEPGADGAVSEAEDDAAAADDADDAAPVKAAPDAPWPIPASKKAASRDDDEEEEEAKPAAAAKKKSVKKPTAAAAAAAEEDEDEEKAPAAAAGKKKPVPASSVVSASAGAAAASIAATEKQVSSLKAQLSDIERELIDAEASASEAKNQLAVAQADAAKLKTDAVKLTAAAAEADKAKAALKAAQAEVTQLKKENATASAALKSTKADAAAEAADLRQEISELKAASAASVRAASDLKDLQSRYAALIDAIKPMVSVFGLNPDTPIGKAIAHYEKAGLGGPAPKTAAAAAKPAAAAPAATTAASKKRGRDAEEEDAEEEEEQPKAKQPFKPAPAAAAASPKRAVSPAPASPVAAAMDEDDDATQPMVATTAADAADEEDFNALDAPASLTHTVVKPAHAGVPMSFARLPMPASAPAATQLVLVGFRGGAIDLFEVNAHTGANKNLVLKPQGRPSHKFAAKGGPAGEEGEDFSAGNHVQALLAMRLTVRANAAAEHYLVLAGEGRLLRSYVLTLGSVNAFTFVAEHDVGDGSWVTVLTALKAPPAAAEANQMHVGVGVSGAGHCVQLYSCASIATSLIASGAPKLQLERSFPVRSDEVRGLEQLSDGRLVVGCVSSALEGDLNEGGAIEIWSWQGGEKPTFLKNDLRVHPSVGLRCNGVRVFHSGGKDQLLAAYEFCSNGARQLTQYTIEKGGMDSQAVNVEAKNTPPLTENTFTSIDVSPDGSKAVALVYGGKLLVFDLSSKKKLATIEAHRELENEECSHVFLASSGRSTAILTMGGKAEIRAWAKK